MNSHTTEAFREVLSQLPEHIQRQAREAYRIFRDNPNHPSLWFKQVHPTRPIYSARVSLGYRALGIREGDDNVRFWIGSHADYEGLIRRM